MCEIHFWDELILACFCCHHVSVARTTLGDTWCLQGPGLIGGFYQKTAHGNDYGPNMEGGGGESDSKQFLYNKMCLW